MKKLDMEKIWSKESKFISAKGSTEEALRDVEPFLTEEEIKEILKNNKTIKIGESKMEQRKIQILRNDNWEDSKFEDLKIGDKFKMLEPTGETVKDNDGNFEFVAISDAYMNEDGILTINIEN